MSTDLHPKTQNSQAPSNPRYYRGARWWKLGLLVIGAVVVVAIAATFISGAVSPSESGPRLTHTIARGDLVVSVTEQGTLESSNNTELKCKVRRHQSANHEYPYLAGHTRTIQG